MLSNNHGHIYSHYEDPLKRELRTQANGYSHGDKDTAQAEAWTPNAGYGYGGEGDGVQQPRQP